MLSKRTKYGLNALVELARTYGQGPRSSAEIAAAANVPRKFLEAILLDLRNAGILSSRKGRSGGHQLRKAPADIPMADVLRLFDGAIGLVPCVTHDYYERCEECVDEATCAVRDVFLAIRAATVEMLKNATLANLLEREQRLKRKVKRQTNK
ncbi:MAG: Rrf2 family transcriptional regulator [Flavobacteriales bacterium]